jgi:hypothetical protein
VVGLDRHPVLDQVDRQLGVAGEQLVHQALEVWRQVLDHDERHAGVGRQVVEEPGRWIEAAGRSTDTHHVARGHPRERLLSHRRVLHGPCRTAVAAKMRRDVEFRAGAPGAKGGGALSRSSAIVEKLHEVRAVDPGGGRSTYR